MSEERERVLSKKTLSGFLGRYKYVVLVIVAGIFLLLVPTNEKEGEMEAVQTFAEEDFSVSALEERLAEILSEIDGAGHVRVMLTVESGTKRVLAQDGTIDQEDGTLRRESETVVISSGSGTQETVLVQQIYPKFQGALVVADGGGDPSIQFKITEAVSALTGLGADKISVCKGK